MLFFSDGQEPKKDALEEHPLLESAPATAEPRVQKIGAYLTAQLAFFGGIWLGIVPLPMLVVGHPLGGLTGGVVSTGFLFVALQGFLSGHPALPFHVHLRSYGWEIIRSRDGRKLHLMILRPSQPELQAIDEEARARYLERAAIRTAQRADSPARSTWISRLGRKLHSGDSPGEQS